jgi:hypothetical protein
MTSLILQSHAADLSHPIAVSIVGIGIGLYLFYQGFHLLQRRHLLLDTPLSKIRSASMGMVELSGLAAGPYTVISPITARSCYFYRTLVWELKQCGRNKQWVKVAAECMHVPFFLEDTTGKVMVDPSSAELDLHCDFKQEFCDSFFTMKDKVPESVRDMLSRHAVATTNRVKVEEFCIKPKNALFVLGTLGENPGLELTPQPICDDEHNTLTFGKSLWVSAMGGASSFLETIRNHDSSEEEPSVSQRLFGGIALCEPVEVSASAGSEFADTSGASSPEVIRRSTSSGSTAVDEMTQPEKIAAVLMKAGITNPAAWQAASIAPSNTVTIHIDQDASANSPTHDFETHPAVVLAKGKNNATFLISWRSQSEIARSLGWKCALMIWGGPALALLCLYGLLTLTHSLS